MLDICLHLNAVATWFDTDCFEIQFIVLYRSRAPPIKKKNLEDFFEIKVIKITKSKTVNGEQ